MATIDQLENRVARCEEQIRSLVKLHELTVASLEDFNEKLKFKQDDIWRCFSEDIRHMKL